MNVIGDTIRAKMMDVGENNEEHSIDNRKRKKWNERKVGRIGGRNVVKKSG